MVFYYNAQNKGLGNTCSFSPSQEFEDACDRVVKSEIKRLDLKEPRNNVFFCLNNTSSFFYHGGVGVITVEPFDLTTRGNLEFATLYLNNFDEKKQTRRKITCEPPKLKKLYRRPHPCIRKFKNWDRLLKIFLKDEELYTSYNTVKEELTHYLHNEFNPSIRAGGDFAYILSEGLCALESDDAKIEYLLGVKQTTEKYKLIVAGDKISRTGKVRNDRTAHERHRAAGELIIAPVSIKFRQWYDDGVLRKSEYDKTLKGFNRSLVRINASLSEKYDYRLGEMLYHKILGMVEPEEVNTFAREYFVHLD